MYNNITKNSKTMVGRPGFLVFLVELPGIHQEFTRNPGLPGRIARNPPGILVFLVGLLGFLQEYVGQWKVLTYAGNIIFCNRINLFIILN